MADYFSILAAIVLLSVPCIASLHFSWKHQQNPSEASISRDFLDIPSIAHWFTTGYCASSASSIDGAFYPTNMAIYVGRWDCSYLKNNPQTLPYHTPAKKWFGLLPSLDRLCFTEVGWALVFAAVFAPYDNPLYINFVYY